MKQRFIRKSQNNRYVRPMLKRCPNNSNAQPEAVVENKEIKEQEKMTKAEEVAAMVSQTKTTKKSTRKATAKKSDGLIERVDITYKTEDNKTLLND